MFPLHTAHGAVQLFARETFQTHSVKTKRALVVVQCCEEKCFFPDIPGTVPVLLMGSQGLRGDISGIIPGHREQGGGTGPFPRGQPDGPGCGRAQSTCTSQQLGDNRDLDLGSSHWMILGFAGDIALSSAESLLLGMKLLQRKGHDLTKLARSAPQNSKLQAPFICKPSHNSSSAHAGRDSFPIKLSRRNHQPEKPQAGTSAGPTRLLPLFMESRRQTAL